MEENNVFKQTHPSDPKETLPENTHSRGSGEQEGVEVLKAALQSLTIGLSSNRNDGGAGLLLCTTDVSEQLSRLGKAVETVNLEITQLRGSNLLSDQRILDLEKKLEGKKEEINTLKEQNINMQSTLEYLNVKIGELEKEITQLRHERDQLKDEADNIRMRQLIYSLRNGLVLQLSKTSRKRLLRHNILKSKNKNQWPPNTTTGDKGTFLTFSTKFGLLEKVLTKQTEKDVLSKFKAQVTTLGLVEVGNVDNDSDDGSDDDTGEVDIMESLDLLTESYTFTGGTSAHPVFNVIELIDSIEGDEKALALCKLHQLITGDMVT